MGRKRHSPEEIIGKLREAEVLIARGQTTPKAAKAVGVTEQTYYRWRREYGGMKVESGETAQGTRAGEPAASSSDV